MAYDEGLAQRIRELLEDREEVEEKRMFGGVAWMVRGNLACGVHKESMIVRVGPDGYAAALEKPHVSVFDITGKPMKGWVMVAADGYESDTDLKDWVDRGVTFAFSLPAK